MTETDPPLEVYRHIDRLSGDIIRGHPGTDGDHLGQLRVARAHDLLMWVGETYYPTPEDFVDECRRLGLSKAIPVGASQDPPVVNPGRTRVWLIHPTAIVKGHDESGEPEHVPGVIGYAYVTDVIYTGTTVDGEVQFPEWAVERAKAGRMDLVEIGERVPAAAEGSASLGDFEDADSGPQTDASADRDVPDAVVEKLVEAASYNDLQAVASAEGVHIPRDESGHRDIARRMLEAGYDLPAVADLVAEHAESGGDRGG